MNRGLMIVLVGLAPMLLMSAIDSLIKVSDANARVFGSLGLLATGALFVWGTALIVTDKGHSLPFGIVLGLLAPIGTMVALLLNDKNRPESDSFIDAVPEENV